MCINHFVPQPRFERFLCYLKSFGYYAEETEHYENRPNGLTPYTCHIVRAGKGYVQIGEEFIELQKDCGFLYGLGVSQQYYADRNERWGIRCDIFTGRGLGALLQGSGK